LFIREASDSSIHVVEDGIFTGIVEVVDIEYMVEVGMLGKGSGPYGFSSSAGAPDA